ncbi:hypothetical protein JB92DRAFT_1441012 [Gautieria morchelliformis]|nr:hypothetical protein JB92DRAFT_1441012 [Gautieria morchelliformis]
MHPIVLLCFPFFFLWPDSHPGSCASRDAGLYSRSLHFELAEMPWDGYSNRIRTLTPHPYKAPYTKTSLINDHVPRWHGVMCNPYSVTRRDRAALSIDSGCP